MEAKQTHAHRLPRRQIVVAAALAERFLNPDMAAYGRLHFAEARMWSGKFRQVRQSNHRDYFWHCVGRALSAAYGRRGCPTEYERAVRSDIDAARAAITKATQ